MDGPLISIVVPIYQADKFLEKSIKSILDQTLRNIEVILVDDGSTDRSGEICDGFAARDKRVKCIHKQNGGQSLARSIGIDNATGKYVGFMDSDDFLYPDMCKMLYEYAEKYNADISGSSYITQDEDGNITHDNHTQESHIYDNYEGVKAYLSLEIDLYVWTKIYRRDLLNEYKIRFEENLGTDEDWLFNNAAFFAAKKTIIIDTPLYRYLERKNSNCRSFPRKKFKTYLENTCYRITKTEEDVQNKFPDLLYIAKLRTIEACVQMLFIISKNKRKECEPYYSWIKKYFRKNASIVIRERKQWSMSWLGTFLAAYMSTGIYYYFKKWKHRKDAV